MNFVNFILPILFLCLIYSCKNEPLLQNASNDYSTKELDSITYRVIRYIGKLPGKANHGTKFNAEFDEFYSDLAKNHELVYFIKNDDSYYYFLFTRVAPSIHLKKVAIGGKLKASDSKITYYEEAFRTWKMFVPELETKMNEIFKDYLKGNDLSKYYTKNSNGKEYIEFPDDQNYFDIDKRIWVSSIDFMEPFYELKKGVDTIKNKQ